MNAWLKEIMLMLHSIIISIYYHEWLSVNLSHVYFSVCKSYGINLKCYLFMFGLCQELESKGWNETRSYSDKKMIGLLLFIMKAFENVKIVLENTLEKLNFSDAKVWEPVYMVSLI